MGFDYFMLSTVFETVFFLVFALVITVIVIALFKAISTWNRNNHSPRLSVFAQVVAKREDVAHHRTDPSHIHSATWYYVTFEVESGDRIELSLTGTEYGMLAEGDAGTLTFQRTRYLSFERL